MIPTLVFDIETIPDTDGLKGLLGLPLETSADDVVITDVVITDEAITDVVITV